MAEFPVTVHVSETSAAMRGSWFYFGSLNDVSNGNEKTPPAHLEVSRRGRNREEAVVANRKQMINIMPDEPTLATAGNLITCVHISKISTRVQTFVKKLRRRQNFPWR